MQLRDGSIDHSRLHQLSPLEQSGVVILTKQDENRAGHIFKHLGSEQRISSGIWGNKPA